MVYRLIALLLCASTASAQTYYNQTTIPPTITTNTVVGNGTSGTAAPQQLPVGTCSTAGSALKWTTNTGFGCNTAIDAATLGGATFASPSPLGATTPGTGAGNLGAGTTAQRPTPANGMCRYNSSFGYQECYNNSTWRPMGGIAVVPGCASGAAVTHTGDTSETNLAICTIPAGMVCANCGLRITEYASRSATTTNTVTYLARWSASSGDVAAGTVIQTWSNATSGAVGQNCQSVVFNANATGAQVMIGPTQNQCAFSGTATASVLAGTLDTTAITYVNFNCKDVTSSADSCGYKSWFVELISP